MERRIFVWISAALASAFASAALADVELVEQHRQLSTFATVVVGEEFANDGEVFNDDEPGPTELQDEVDVSIGASTSHAGGWHISVIEPSTFSMTGTTGATAEVDPAAEDAFAEANGATTLSVRFRVFQHTEYVLAGGLTEGGAGDVHLSLHSVEQGNLWTLSPEPDGTLVLGEFGVLAPGQYLLTFASGGYAQAGSPSAVDFASGAMDFSFDLLSVVAVPEAAPSAGDLSLRPNPVRTGAPVYLRIDGVPRESPITILDVAGRRLARLSPTGGRAIWDGRDTDGRRVSPGVYFARVDGTDVATRVAVVR